MSEETLRQHRAALERSAAKAREYLIGKATTGHALPPGWQPAPPIGEADPLGSQNLARACTISLDELQARYLPRRSAVSYQE
jgi:hypothetical protein